MAPLAYTGGGPHALAGDIGGGPAGGINTVGRPHHAPAGNTGRDPAGGTNTGGGHGLARGGDTWAWVGQYRRGLLGWLRRADPAKSGLGGTGTKHNGGPLSTATAR